MANNRTIIIDALVQLFKDNLTGNSPYLTNFYENIKPKQIFWDEVDDFPLMCIYAGEESREYQASNFKWAFLTVNIRFYIKDDDAKTIVEQVFEDVELLIDNNNDLRVAGNDLSTDIRLLSLSDDEGLLHPIGVGEITLQVRYEV